MVAARRACRPGPCGRGRAGDEADGGERGGPGEHGPASRCELRTRGSPCVGWGRHGLRRGLCIPQTAGASRFSTKNIPVRRVKLSKSSLTVGGGRPILQKKSLTVTNGGTAVEAGHQQAQVSAMRALAHPVRLQILSLLTGTAMSASEVARELGITQANASYHLRQLVDAHELVEAGEEKIRGGVAKRYRHPWESGPRSTGPRSGRRARPLPAGARRGAGTARPDARAGHPEHHHRRRDVGLPAGPRRGPRARHPGREADPRRGAASPDPGHRARQPHRGRLRDGRRAARRRPARRARAREARPADAHQRRSDGADR